MGGGTLAALVCFTGIDSAKALDFNFSFDDTFGNTSGTVEGTIQGLNDNSTGAASAVLITSFPVGGSFDIGNNAVLWDTVAANLFTVTNGAITAASFEASATGSDDIFCLSPSTGNFCPNSFNALTLDNSSTFVRNDDGFGGATYSAATPVPFETEPTLGILLAAGLFGSRHLYRRHRARKVLLDK